MRNWSLIALATLAAGCTALPPPASPATRPVYRAVGTEPFWALTISARKMSFTQPDAQPVVQPTPKTIVGFAGEIYRTAWMDVNIVHAQCSDGMSDRVYPDKVQVTVDGRRFNGCGGL
jgi:uncharacterized membrane protein